MQRLDLLSGHLSPAASPPFSSEKNLQQPLLTFQLQPPPQQQPPQQQEQLQGKEQEQSIMSSQAPHPTLLIPGPIEFDDAVLQSMGHYA